jgi:hypothetical protein
MLIDETSVWKNPRTGLWERMFPSDFAPPGFRAISPSTEELADWLLDPAIASALREGSFSLDRGNFSQLELGRLDVLTSLRLVDFARAQEGRIYELVSNVGLVRPEDIQTLAPTANAMIGALVGLMQTEPGALAEDIAKEAAFAFYGVMSSLTGSMNPYVALATQVVGLVSQLWTALQSARVGEADLAAARLPLHTVDARKRSDDARVSALRLELAQSRDWTELFLPAYEGNWVIRELGEPRPARQGFGLGMAAHDDELLTPSGGWGMMPGTGRCLDLLQLEPNWRSLRDIQENRTDAHGRPLPPTANWYSYYCDAADKGCFQSPEQFAGTKDCRQCIPIDSIRGSSRGDWREYSHSFVSTAVNVGDWLANSTQSLTALWDSFSATNPATYCIDTERIHHAWQRVWEDFFDVFIPEAWNARDAYAWRALVSHFASWSLVSREDGLLGGRGTLLDWRWREWGAYQDEGIVSDATPPIPPVYSGCPVDQPGCFFANDRTSLQRITATPFLLEHSVWKRAIEPTVQHTALTQLAGYGTTMCAYLWMDQGAHADPDTGELKKNRFGKAFHEGLQRILTTPRLRNAVHMAHVVDPRIKKMLLEAGAHPWQTGSTVAAPESSSTDGKPPRARMSADDRPVVGFDDDWTPPPPAPPPVGGYPLGPIEAQPTEAERPAPTSRTGRIKPAAVVAGGALVGALGWAASRRRPRT